jgi:hypothetical protein
LRAVLAALTELQGMVSNHKARAGSFTSKTKLPNTGPDTKTKTKPKTPKKTVSKPKTQSKTKKKVKK